MCQRLKDEVRGEFSGVTGGQTFSNMSVCPTPDLHAEMTRNNRKKKQTTMGLPSQVTSAENQGVGSEGVAHPSTPLNQSHHQEPNTPTVPMDTSPLIKANPSPQGTPMHTTFTGTQRFTPSTRISALNMVGDLLRKVGVRTSPELTLLCVF